jgi:hypothetical protein
MHVYRLIAKETVEERVLMRSEKKLFLDQMVNRGSTAQGEALEKLTSSELLSALTFGADSIFSNEGGAPPTDFELDAIIDRTPKGSVESPEKKVAAKKGRKTGPKSTKEKGADDGAESGLQVGVQRTAANFEPAEQMVKIREFRGKLYNRQGPSPSKGSSMKDIANEWKEQVLHEKRERHSRLVTVNGQAVLKKNMYDLESGEPSVFEKELSTEDQRAMSVFTVHSGRQVAGRDYDNVDFCIGCWGIGGELMCCDYCPASYHPKCAGYFSMGDAPTTQWSCPHHSCSECGRKAAAAGGLLFRCEVCPKTYCEDHLPEVAAEKYLIGKCERFMETGCKHQAQACYIHCSAHCHEFATKDPVKGGGKKNFCAKQVDLLLAKQDASAVGGGGAAAGLTLSVLGGEWSRLQEDVQEVLSALIKEKTAKTKSAVTPASEGGQGGKGKGAVFLSKPACRSSVGTLGAKVATQGDGLSFATPASRAISTLGNLGGLLRQCVTSVAEMEVEDAEAMEESLSRAQAEERLTGVSASASAKHKSLADFALSWRGIALASPGGKKSGMKKSGMKVTPSPVRGSPRKGANGEKVEKVPNEQLRSRARAARFYNMLERGLESLKLSPLLVLASVLNFRGRRTAKRYQNGEKLERVNEGKSPASKAELVKHLAVYLTYPTEKHSVLQMRSPAEEEGAVGALAPKMKKSPKNPASKARVVFMLESGVIGMYPPTANRPGAGVSPRGGSVAENLAAWKLEVGDSVKALFQGGMEYYSGQVSRARVDGTYDIKFDDGDKEQSVPRDAIVLAANTSSANANTIMKGADGAKAKGKGKGKDKGKKRKAGDEESDDEEVTLYTTTVDDEQPDKIAKLFDLDTKTLIKWNKKVSYEW